MTVARIVVGTDGSSNADLAITWASQLAVALGAELLVIHAVGLLTRVHGDAEPSTALHEELETALTGPWTRAARAAGLQPRMLLEAGPPAMALMRVAEREDVDLVVVGTRGSGREAAFGHGLGSTSLTMAHDCDRPLAIIPHE